MAENRFSKYAQPQVFIPDPTMAAEEARAAAEERRRNEDQTFQADQVRIAQQNANTSAQNAAVTAANANKPAAGYRQMPDGSWAFIPGGPADPAKLAANAAATATAKGGNEPDPDRIPQIQTVLENIANLRGLADDTLAVGAWSGRVDDWPIIGPLLGQNRKNVEGALQMIQGDLIQQQIARLSEVNGGNGVASVANSETEAARMAASIANLSPDQDLEQFTKGLDRAEEYYKRQLAQLMPNALTAPRIINGGAPTAAGFGATTGGEPINPEYQAEYEAWVRDNVGRFTPEEYAAFRTGLDRKYNYDTGADYAAEGARINEWATKGGTLNLAIPPVEEKLSEAEQLRNDLVSNPAGAAITATMNAGGFGIPSYLARDKMAAMREEYPWSTSLGDIAGGVVGTAGTGKLLGAVAGRVTNPTVAQLLANPIGADVAYGGIYGATEADNPVAGFATGTLGAVAGNKLGSLAGKALPRLTGVSPQPDLLTAGERAIYKSVGDPDAVTAALFESHSLGVPVTLADASPELGSLAGSATRFSPTVAGQARDVMARRNQGQLDRLSGAVERDLGPVTNIPQRSENLMQQARSAAGPLYDQAYAAPGATVIDLSDLMARPSMSRALSNAYRIALEEGRDPMTLGFVRAPDGIAGEPLIRIENPSWQTLDYVKRGLDDVLEGYRDKTTGRLVLDTEGRAVNDTLRTFLGRVDEMNPDYAAARSAYAGPAQERGFLQRGQDAVTARPDQLGVDMAGLTPEQTGQMRLGFQSETMARAGNLRNNSNPWAQLNTPNTEGRLGVMYNGAEDTDIARLLAQRDLELQLAGSANRLIGNSATAERSVADEFFKQQPGIGGDVAQGVAETVLLGGPFLTVGKRFGDRMFRDRREAAALAANRSLADEIGPLLLNGNAAEAATQLSDIYARDEVLQELVKASLEKAGIRGGHVGAALGTNAGLSLIN